MTSLACFNKEIEWNYAYFKKVRLCFTASQRKLKDVKFVFKESGVQPRQPGAKKRPHYNKESDSDEEAADDDIERLLGGGSPKFRIYFKV